MSDKADDAAPKREDSVDPTASTSVMSFTEVAAAPDPSPLAAAPALSAATPVHSRERSPAPEGP